MAVAPEAHLVLLHSVEVPFESRLRLAGVRTSVIEQYRTNAREDALRRLAELARSVGVEDGRWTALVPSGLDPWMHIVKQEHEQECDFTVIGKHGRHAIEELLLGSTTSKVIAEGAVDVLVSALADTS